MYPNKNYGCLHYRYLKGIKIFLNYRYVSVIFSMAGQPGGPRPPPCTGFEITLRHITLRTPLT